MDHISQNCIAGASSPYKVLSFTAPAQALALYFHLSGTVTAKPSLKEQVHLTYKHLLCTSCTGFRLAVSTKLGEGFDVFSPAWPDSDFSGIFSGIKSTQILDLTSNLFLTLGHL